MGDNGRGHLTLEISLPEMSRAGVGRAAAGERGPPAPVEAETEFHVWATF